MQIFPLFQKELLEQANKKRTYIVRIAFGVLFFGAFAFSWSKHLQSQTHLQNLGQGKYLIKDLYLFQFICLCLFIPPLTASAIAYEKEKRTLSLLFLSKLRYWEILLEKFLGHLLPIFSLVLMTLPAIFLSYFIGGVSEPTLIFSIIAALFSALSISALSLMFSSYCYSSVSAIIFSYVGIFFLYILFPQIPAIYVLTGDFANFLAMLAYTLIATLIFLLLAHIFLYKRAFIAPHNRLLKIFVVLDRFFKRCNSLFGNIEFKERNSLPGDQPILWREKATKSIGKKHYLIRIFFILQMVTFGGIALRQFGNLFWYIYLSLVATMAIVICFLSVNVIHSERSKQTLNLLLMAPISNKEILCQKLAVIYRLGWVFLSPIAAIHLIALLISGRYLYEHFWSIATYSAYIFSLSWVMLWVGLKWKKKFTAIFMAFAILFAWVILSEFIAKWLSPLFFLERIYRFHSTSTFFFPFHFLWQICLYLFFRYHCLKNVSFYLGRK